MTVKKYDSLQYEDPTDLIFGEARYPVTLNSGISIGGGKVYPELNFTLPPMLIDKNSISEIISQYGSAVSDALKRAVELHAEGLIIEIELLPPFTYEPGWGIETIKKVKDVLSEHGARHDIRTGLRVTPADIREDRRSPHMWHGGYHERIMDVFRGCAAAGADLLAIESIGGKDVHDEAVMYCDIKKSIFSLGILGSKDTYRLWSDIKRIADETGSIASGDTACGFANTAMILADKGYIPKVFAAVVRAVSAVRSLAAIEAGARGPHKDCGYEGIYVKAITGIPISMEGKSSACAHFSCVGNISSAAADLWSNESIQNIKLLSGMAPTVSLEQLIYDCRLLNTSKNSGHTGALLLRDWLIDSDSCLDPQAYILRPDVVIDISREIIKHDSYFERSKAAALKAIEILREAAVNKKVIIDDKEYERMDLYERDLCSLTGDEERFMDEMIKECMSDRFDPSKYDL